MWQQLFHDNQLTTIVATPTPYAGMYQVEAIHRTGQRREKVYSTTPLDDAQLKALSERESVGLTSRDKACGCSGSTSSPVCGLRESLSPWSRSNTGLAAAGMPRCGNGLQAHELIQAQKDKTAKLAQALLVRETLTREEVLALVRS